MHPYVFHAPNVQRLLKIQQKHKILTQPYAPLSPIVRDQGGPVDEVVERIAKDQNASPSQVLLAWNARFTEGCLVTSVLSALKRKSMADGQDLAQCRPTEGAARVGQHHPYAH